MEIVDFVYRQSGFRGVASILNKTVFEGIKQFLSRGGTREVHWEEFREVFSSDLYDFKKVALYFSQRLSEHEYEYYQRKMNVESVMKYPSKFMQLRSLDLSLNFEKPKTLPKSKIQAYYVSPYEPGYSIEVKDFLTMHYYQLWVKNKLSAALSNGANRLIVHLPTGSGKTRTANELVCEKLNSGEAGSVILWVCHSVELCAQAENSLARLLRYRAQREVKIIPYYSNAKDLVIDVEKVNIVYSTYGKLNSYRKKNGLSKLASTTRLVIVDEAHKVLAPTYAQVITELLSHNADLIGLTATPGRGNLDNQVMNKALAAYFYSNLISYKEFNASNLFQKLTAEGYLAHIDHEVLIHSGSFRLGDEALRKFSKTGFIPGEALDDLSSNFSRNDEIIGRIRQLIRAGKQRILVFAASTEHAKILIALLNYGRINAALVLGETLQKDRQEIYRKFKDGAINVIVNFGVLTTGFDEPRLDVCLIARPCSSPVLYSQMVGRALRGIKNGGNEKNLIIDVSDNFIGMPELDQLFIRWNLNY